MTLEELKEAYETGKRERLPFVWRVINARTGQMHSGRKATRVGAEGEAMACVLEQPIEQQRHCVRRVTGRREDDLAAVLLRIRTPRG